MQSVTTLFMLQHKLEGQVSNHRLNSASVFLFECQSLSLWKEGSQELMMSHFPHTSLCWTHAPEQRSQKRTACVIFYCSWRPSYIFFFLGLWFLRSFSRNGEVQVQKLNLRQGLFFFLIMTRIPDIWVIKSRHFCQGLFENYSSSVLCCTYLCYLWC